MLALSTLAFRPRALLQPGRSQRALRGLQRTQWQTMPLQLLGTIPRQQTQDRLHITRADLCNPAWCVPRKRFAATLRARVPSPDASRRTRSGGPWDGCGQGQATGPHTRSSASSASCASRSANATTRKSTGRGRRRANRRSAWRCARIAFAGRTEPARLETRRSRTAYRSSRASCARRPACHRCITEPQDRSRANHLPSLLLRKGRWGRHRMAPLPAARCRRYA